MTKRPTRGALAAFLATLFTLVSIFLPATAAPAQGCPTGEQRPSIEQDYGFAEVVFVGEVTAMREETDATWNSPVDVATFDVQSAWKKPLEDGTLVRTDAGDCGLPFQVGQSWVVYALNVDGKLFAPATGRSELFGPASDSLPLLREIRPASGPALAQEFGETNIIAYVVAAYAIFFILGAGWYYLSRRGKRRPRT